MRETFNSEVDRLSVRVDTYMANQRHNGAAWNQEAMYLLNALDRLLREATKEIRDAQAANAKLIAELETVSQLLGKDDKPFCYFGDGEVMKLPIYEDWPAPCKYCDGQGQIVQGYDGEGTTVYIPCLECGSTGYVND